MRGFRLAPVGKLFSLENMIIGVVFLFFLLLGLAATIFWIVELVDCLKNEPDHGNSKLIWLLVILFGHGIGAVLYWCVRRPQRKAELGR